MVAERRISDASGTPDDGGSVSPGPIQQDDSHIQDDGSGGSPDGGPKLHNLDHDVQNLQESSGLWGPFRKLIYGTDANDLTADSHPVEIEVPRGANVVVRLALLLIGALAFLVRVFSVVRFESVIHEYDPYFNYRVALFTKEHGLREFLNWFDDRTWYPLGRVVGGSTYPGLIFTALLEWRVLRLLHIDVDLKDVCVFTAPVFAIFASWATYGVLCEARPGTQGIRAGLIAALALALSPAYVSRSAGGSFDLEAVAIFAMMNTFWLYLKAANTGRLKWAAAAVLSYWYMAMSWGGYTYVANLIPLHVVACIISGRFNMRLYVAFAPMVAVGTLLVATVPPIGQSALTATEHYPGFFAFALVHVTLLVQYFRRLVSPRAYKETKVIFVACAAIMATVGGLAIATKMVLSPTLGLSGRTLSLLDPTYAAKHIPIIASVSEHQPPSWAGFLMDAGVFMVAAPMGIVLCLAPLTCGSLFLLVFAATSVWFTGVMVRLMLLLSPAVCLLGGMAVSWGIEVSVTSVRAVLFRQQEGGHDGAQGLEADEAAAAAQEEDRDWLRHQGLTESTEEEAEGVGQGREGEDGSGEGRDTSQRAGAGERDDEVIDSRRVGQEGSTSGESGERERQSEASPSGRDWTWEWRKQRPLRARTHLVPFDVAVTLLLLLMGLLVWNLMHCVWVASDVYSTPSVWIPNKVQGESFEAIDDFREAYSWIEHNTPEDAKVASWWDYGYQSTQMSNRTTLTDNNTWNTTHIATVGRAMASPERKGWEILRSLGADYFFVYYGGLVDYPADDISKLTWIMRIAGKEYPEIKEDLIYALDYSGAHMSIGPKGSEYLHSTLVYKLCYHGVRELTQIYRHGDLVRGEVPVSVHLDWFDEVFTSSRYLVRVYRLRREHSRPKPPPLALPIELRG